MHWENTVLSLLLLPHNTLKKQNSVKFFTHNYVIQGRGVRKFFLKISKVCNFSQIVQFFSSSFLAYYYLHITKIVSNDNKGNLVSVLFRYNRPKLYCNLMLISNASGFSSKYNLTEQYTPKVYPWGTSIHRFHYIHHNTMLNFLV